MYALGHAALAFADAFNAGDPKAAHAAADKLEAAALRWAELAPRRRRGRKRRPTMATHAATLDAIAIDELDAEGVDVTMADEEGDYARVGRRAP